MGWRARLAGMRMDVSPLRDSRQFRLVLGAGTVFQLGGMVAYVAVPYQLFSLTHSNFVVGSVALAELVPLVVLGLYGGALADHVDRRRLLVGCGVAQAAVMSVLAANAFLVHPRTWLIFVAASLLAAAESLQRPSLAATEPRTVRHDQVPAATALSWLGMQAGMLVGPAIGGVLIAVVGTPWCYVGTVASMVVATGLFMAMRPVPHEQETTPPSLRAVVEGIGYAARRRDLLGTYLVDVAAMVLAMPVVLFPALAQDVLERPHLLGLLYSAETIGAIGATVTSGWTGRVRHHGRAIVLAAAAYGLAIALAGVMPTVGLTVVCLALGGAADTVSGVFRSTVWNQTIPDSMRGRLAGIEMLSYSLGPLGGQLRAGLVADVWSVRASITSGGVLCVLGVAATSTWLRDFWRYDARTDEHAVAERARRAHPPQRGNPL